jgi:hypothetical protein
MQALLAVFDISFVLQGSHGLVPPELNSPSLQGEHCVSASTEHAASKPSPTAQDLHGIQADLALFAISLTPQVLHVFSPPSLNSPRSHGPQTASVVEVHGLTIPSPTAQDRQELHFVDLGVFANVPGSQGCCDML